MILVTGATGSVGRLVVDQLVDAGAGPVRALTADPAKAALPDGVEVVEGRLARPEDVRAALRGIERMYLAPLPSAMRMVVGLAAEAGVGKIVDLAGPKESWWGSVEVAVEQSGVPWTHLEAGEFMDNSLWMWAEQIRTTGRVRDAYPSSADAPIALDDIAAVAAVALLQDGHLGRAYQLTGPETLTRAERVRLIGEALGREIPFVEIDHVAAVEQLSSTSLHPIDWYVDFAATLVEHPQPPTTTVAQLTGRPATTFAQWAVAHSNHFR